MPAYIVVDVEVTDPVAYETYKELAAPAVTLYGGRYLARGGKLDVLEGAWQPKRLVVLEFPSAEHARRWYDGSEYRAAREARAGAANMNMVIVDGL